MSANTTVPRAGAAVAALAVLSLGLAACGGSSGGEAGGSSTPGTTASDSVKSIVYTYDDMEQVELDKVTITGDKLNLDPYTCEGSVDTERANSGTISADRKKVIWKDGGYGWFEDVGSSNLTFTSNSIDISNQEHTIYRTSGDDFSATYKKWMNDHCN